MCAPVARTLLLAGILGLFVVATAPGPEPPSASQLRGAQTHPLWSDSSTADFDRELDLLREAGATAVRIDITWSSLEPTGKGEFARSYVTRADAFMQHARERGLKVIVTLHA